MKAIAVAADIPLLLAPVPNVAANADQPLAAELASAAEARLKDLNRPEE